MVGAAIVSTAAQLDVDATSIHLAILTYCGYTYYLQLDVDAAVVRAVHHHRRVVPAGG